MLEVEILVRKRFRTVYSGAAGAIAIEEISALNHEVFDLRSIRNNALAWALGLCGVWY